MDDDELIRDVTDAQLAQARLDIVDEGYSIIEETKGPTGLWNIQIRKDAANGAPQSAEGDDAVQPQQQPEPEPERPQLSQPPPADPPQQPQQPDPQPPKQPQSQQPDPEPPKPQQPSAPQPSVPQPPVLLPSAPQPCGLLTLGPDGERLIKAFESCAKKLGPNRFGAYLDSVRVPTIGWGHTNSLGRKFDMSAVWTRAECDAEFVSDMRVFEAGVRRLVKVPLNQFQFDALVSFCYNCGPGNLASSTLLRNVNQKNFSAAAEQFGRWVKAKGQTLPGLVRRRKYEARLFRGIRDLTYP
jgi:lysozyme